MLSNNSDYDTSGLNYMAGSSQHPFAPMNQSNNSNPFSVPPYNHHSSMPKPPMNNTNPQMQQPYYNNTNPQMQQPYYPPPMQPPPPPPSNGGYMPTYIPRSENAVNIASSSSSGGAPGGAGGGYARPGQGFAARMGAGAVVGAAAAYYGSEFLSGGFDLPSSLPLPNVSSLPLPNVSISIDPPF